jgi:predicted nucleic-acid-binding protein
MLAVDTNILVRIITNDNPDQAASAKAALTSEPVWIAKTVLLETAWVLTYYYNFDDAAIRNAYVNLLGIPNFQAEDADAVAAALALCAQGLQLADALHLMSRAPGSTFVTFDKALVKRAKRAGITNIEHP